MEAEVVESGRSGDSSRAVGESRREGAVVRVIRGRLGNRGGGGRGESQRRSRYPRAGWAVVRVIRGRLGNRGGGGRGESQRRSRYPRAGGDAAGAVYTAPLIVSRDLVQLTS
jgi:hypothetical protein